MLSKKRKAFANHHSLLSIASKVTGDLHFSGEFYLDGTIKGNVYAEQGKPSKLIINQTGVVEGDIHAPHILVNGRVRGAIYSVGHVELAAKAVVEGTIHYQSIEMVKGAQLIGQLVRAAGATDAVDAEKAAPIEPSSIKK